MSEKTDAFARTYGKIEDSMRQPMDIDHEPLDRRDRAWFAGVCLFAALCWGLGVWMVTR